MTTGTTGGSTYLAALKEPGVARICTFGVLARMPDSMVAITLLLLVRGHGGYALGGLLVGVIGVCAAVSGPLWGRLADRHGARAVLLGTGAAEAALLILLGPAVRHGAGLGLAVAALDGFFRAPAAGVVRAQWASLPTEPRRVMQALESALTELIFTVGPVLVGVVLLLASPAVALVVAAALVACGTTGLASSPTLRPGRRQLRTGDLWGPIRLASVRLLTLLFFLQVVAFGSVEVGLTTLCANTGHTPLAGVLIALWASGSAVGGLVYGRRVRGGDPLRQLMFLNAATGLLLGLFAVSGNPFVLLAVAIPGGVAIAPGAQTAAGVLSRAVPEDQLAEAFGWVSHAAPALGAAVGYAVAAALAEDVGPRGAIVTGAGVGLAAALVVVLGRKRLSG